MLAEFWTTISWNRQSNWNWLLPFALRAQLARRAFPQAPKERIKCDPWREMVRLGAGATRLNGFLASGEKPFSIIGVYRHLDRVVADRVKVARPDATYAYEGGALQTFRKAKELGIPKIYELPSSYWHWARSLFAEEAERNPQFADLHPVLEDSARHLEWKDEELRLADYVFVPSEHVRHTLSGIIEDKRIQVVTYGAPPVRPRKETSNSPKEPLKVLFAGSLIQRKGIGYLLEAIDLLGSQVNLTLVGRRFRPNPHVDAACNRWRWFESLPHSEVLKLMQQVDVLVLPSLTEGCALVVLEALACGLPVIVTRNTGSLEFVRDGREGFVVPICSSTSIAERLLQLHTNRELLVQMSRNAHATAAEKSWDAYRVNWANAVRRALCH